MTGCDDDSSCGDDENHRTSTSSDRNAGTGFNRENETMDVEYCVKNKRTLFGNDDGKIYVVRNRRPNTFTRDYVSNRDSLPVTYEIDATDARGIIEVLSEWLEEREDEEDDQ